MLNSAAVMALPNFEKSVDGIELQFSTNHLGHFLLTALTYPLFAPGSRIVNVSSTGHCLGPINFPSLETINFNDGATYTEWGAYGQSKCANVLFSRYLAQKFQEKAKDIAAFSLHPGGIVGTGLEKHLVDPDWTEIFKIFDNVGRQRPKMKTLAEGTSTMLVACLDPRIAGEFCFQFLRLFGWRWPTGARS
jgi:NAD(P)-dependent dehydrogenase (short-subunit alcohol dehydrogenase family)